MMFGNIIEGSKRFGDSSYAFRVALVKESTDMHLVNEICPDYKYNIEDQIDIFSRDKNVKKPIADRYFNFAQNKEILQFLEGGELEL